MRFGVCVPNYGETSSVEGLRRITLRAEELGYDSIWSTDHILMQKNSGTPYERIFDSISTLAFLSSLTEKVHLGVSSLIIGMRNPIVVAKQLASIDNFSKGRLIVAMSAGWNEKEFANLGSDFHNRGRRVDESIKLITDLWSGKTTFSGRFRFNDVAFESPPVQKHLPIWIGGTSEAAMRRAARFGDAWHPNVLPWEKFKPMVSAFRKIAPDEEQKRICVRIALNLKAKSASYVAPQGEQRVVLSSNTNENKRIIEELESLGASYSVLAPSPDGKVPVEEQIRGLELISAEFF